MIYILNNGISSVASDIVGEKWFDSTKSKKYCRAIEKYSAEFTDL